MQTGTRHDARDGYLAAAWPRSASDAIAGAEEAQSGGSLVARSALRARTRRARGRARRRTMRRCRRRGPSAVASPGRRCASRNAVRKRHDRSGIRCSAAQPSSRRLRSSSIGLSEATASTILRPFGPRRSCRSRGAALRNCRTLRVRPVGVGPASGGALSRRSPHRRERFARRYLRALYGRRPARDAARGTLACRCRHAPSVPACERTRTNRGDDPVSRRADRRLLGGPAALAAQRWTWGCGGRRAHRLGRPRPARRVASA